MAVAAALVTPHTAHFTGTWHFGWGTLPSGPVVIAFVRVALNGLAVRLWAAGALSRADVPITYSIVTIAGALGEDAVDAVAAL